MTGTGRGRGRIPFAAPARLAVAALLLAGACTGADRREAAAPSTTTAPASTSSSALPDDLAPVPDSVPAPGAPAVGSSPRPAGRAGAGTSATTPAAGSSTTSTAFRASGPKCPDPRTCDVYQINFGKGWRPGADGVARIPVYINPTPPLGSALTAETIEADFLAMMGMWEEASPAVRFRYLGRTTREPRSNDGYSDLSYGHYVLEKRDIDGYMIEADLMRTPGPGDRVASYPCDWHRDGACGPVDTGKNDTRQVTAHELGHVLGGGDLGGDDAENLTMYHGSLPGGDRRRVTLGLGDILFVRHLYPCGCPLPRIYVP